MTSVSDCRHVGGDGEERDVAVLWRSRYGNRQRAIAVAATEHAIVQPIADEEFKKEEEECGENQQGGEAQDDDGVEGLPPSSAFPAKELLPDGAVGESVDQKIESSLRIQQEHI